MIKTIASHYPWVSPLVAAQCLGRFEACWMLLYSGKQERDTGRYSYLALYPQQQISGDAFNELNNALSSDKMAFDNAWFGFIGYEMLHNDEEFPAEANRFIELPDILFTQFGLVLCFDHSQKKVMGYRQPHIPPPLWPNHSIQISVQSTPDIESLTSSMSKERYLDIVNETKDSITKGYFYQANITRKFMGRFKTSPDSFSLFLKLSEASPAVYSAFLKLGSTAVLSSSPECFLTVDADGNIKSRPIKGTAPRYTDHQADLNSRQQLEQSEKNKAENLMIVDLMRNDLARSSEVGSIHISNLFEVSSYSTLHHMSTSIEGKKLRNTSCLDVVRACFPPGSMTGAPKISAITWCKEQEKIQRGVYSGALGWFSGDGACDLSVVIRTLIVDDKNFEFQVGGGIVADSDPLDEWQETMLKARGILRALNLDSSMLESI